MNETKRTEALPLSENGAGSQLMCGEQGVVLPQSESKLVKLWAIMWWALSRPRSKGFPVKTIATLVSLLALWLL